MPLCLTPHAKLKNLEYTLFQQTVPNAVPINQNINKFFQDIPFHLGMCRIVNFTIRPEPDSTRVASEA